jgi:hypothetical protein
VQANSINDVSPPHMSMSLTTEPFKPQVALCQSKNSKQFSNRSIVNCASAKGILAKATPQQLAPVLESMRTSPRASALTELLDELGAEAGLAFAISLRAGMNADDALAFAKEAGHLFAHLRPTESPHGPDTAEDGTVS